MQRKLGGKELPAVCCASKRKGAHNKIVYIVGIGEYLTHANRFCCVARQQLTMNTFDTNEQSVKKSLRLCMI